MELDVSQAAYKSVAYREYMAAIEFISATPSALLNFILVFPRSIGDSLGNIWCYPVYHAIFNVYI